MQRLKVSTYLACAVLTLVSQTAGAQPTFESARSVVAWPGRSFHLGAAAVAAGDVDGDGVTDLVAVSPADPRIAILKGTGGGNFAAATYVVSGSGADKVVIADLDRNGVQDIIVSSLAESGIRVFYGMGLGQYFSTTYNTSTKVRSLAVADLNGDGYLDLIAASVDQPIVMVLTQLPLMSDFREDIEPTHGLPTQIKVADMNGDGHSDLLIGTKLGFDVHYKQVSGDDGPFEALVFVSGGFDEIAAADFNKDGIVDVIGLQATGLIVTVAGRAGTPAFVSPGGLGYPTFSVGQFPVGLTVADLDGDGWLDVVVANEFATGGPPIVQGTGAHMLVGGSVIDHGVEKFTFLPGPTLAVGPQPFGVLLADVNGDTLPDLLAADLGASFTGEPQADVSVLLRQVTAADLQRLVSALTTTQQQNVALAAQVRAARQESVDLSAQLAAAYSQNSTLAGQNSQLQAQVTQRTTERDTALASVASLTGQVAQLTTERDTARASVASLTDQVAALNADQNVINAQVTQLQNANTQLAADKAALQTSLDAANANLVTVTAQVASLIAEKNVINAQVTLLQNANTQLGEDKAALQTSLDAANANVVTLTGQVTSLQGANAQLGTDKAALQAALTAANTSLTAANAGLAAANASLGTAAATLAAANQTIGNLQASFVAANQTIASLTERVASLAAALTDATDGIAEDLASVERDLQVTFRNPRFNLPGDTVEEQLDAIIGALQDLNKGAKQDLYRDLGGRRVPHRGHHR